MTRANLQQTRVGLDVWLESYEDILYQVYTDDPIVEVVDRINAGEDIANNRKTLRRILRGLFYTKDYVKSIAVITEGGELVFYDQLTASTTDTSWMDSIQLSQKELYEEISRDNRTHLLPTGSRVEFGSNSCYLFHIGHRLIDYRNIGKQCGVVLVSIDESLLQDICSSSTESGLNFIVDSKGYVISCPGAAEIGRALFPEDAGETEKQAAYRQLARQTGLLEGEEFQDVTAANLVNGEKIFVAFQNYAELFRDSVFRSSLGNTLLYTVLCLVFQFVIGFALALFFSKKFTFAKPVRGILLVPWMVPVTVTALIFKLLFATDIGVINYILRSLHLISSNIEWLTTPGTALFALICANVWIGIPFSVLILKNYFASIPSDLEEAAYLDGCNRFTAFLRVLIPIAKPGVMVCAIFSFLYAWGDLAYGMTFILDQEMRPITAGIFNFMGQYGTKWSYLTAFAVVTIIPVALIFIFMQKYIISGMTSGAVKG